MRKVALSMCLIPFLLLACAGNQSIRTNAYKTLAASATVYESAYPAFLDLASKGIVSPEVRTQGRALALQYWAAYHVAADALASYEKVQTAEGVDKINVAIGAMQQALYALSTYIQPFLVKGVK